MFISFQNICKCQLGSLHIPVAKDFKMIMTSTMSVQFVGKISLTISFVVNIEQ